MIEGIAGNILRNGGKIKLNYDIKEIDLKNKLINRKIKYDILINTIPIPEFIKISKNMPLDYKKKVSNVRYCPCVTVVFGTKSFLSRHYWLNIFNERIHMIMQHSNLYDGYDEKINWCLRYGGSEEDLKLNNDEIREKYLDVVKKYFPNCEIVWSKVFKEKYSEPVYDKDYFSYKPCYRTPMRGVYNAGIAVTYPKIRNMNTVFESGLKVAEMVRKDFGVS
jgi:protoporphyrinogen oxidase